MAVVGFLSGRGVTQMVVARSRWAQKGQCNSSLHPLNMKALHSSNPDKNPTDTFLGFAFAGPGAVFLPSCHGDCPFQVVWEAGGDAWVMEWNCYSWFEKPTVLCWGTVFLFFSTCLNLKISKFWEGTLFFLGWGQHFLCPFTQLQVSSFSPWPRLHQFWSLLLLSGIRSPNRASTFSALLGGAKVMRAHRTFIWMKVEKTNIFFCSFMMLRYESWVLTFYF